MAADVIPNSFRNLNLNSSIVFVLESLYTTPIKSLGCHSHENGNPDSVHVEAGNKLPARILPFDIILIGIILFSIRLHTLHPSHHRQYGVG